MRRTTLALLFAVALSACDPGTYTGPAPAAMGTAGSGTAGAGGGAGSPGSTGGAAGRSGTAGGQAGGSAGGAAGGTAGGTAGGAAGTSGAAGQPGGDGGLAGEITGSRMLCGTIDLTGDAIIATGATVTLCDGALVRAAALSSLTVKGTLTVGVGTTGARLGDAGWKGLIVDGGTVTGRLTIVGADQGLTTRTGQATLTDLSMERVKVPFDLGVGSTVTITRGNIRAAGLASLKGKLSLDHVTWDSGGSEGAAIGDASAEIHAVDSTFSIGGSADFFVSNAAATLTLAHSKITSTHCALHINAIGTLDINHNIITGNAYGFMIGGGTGAGQRVVTQNNIMTNSSAGIEQISDSQLIDMRGNYFGMNGMDVLMSTLQGLDAGGRLTAPVADAGPRP